MGGLMKTCIIILSVLMSFPSLADTKSNVDQAHELAKDYGDKLKQKIKAAENRAVEQDLSSIEQTINDPAYKAKIKTYAHNLNLLINNESEVQSISGDDSNDADHELKNMGNRVLLFVSSSMPLDVLRIYAKDLYKIDGIMVFTGFIGGANKIIPTQNFVRKIILEDTKCDTINCNSINLKVAFDPKRFTAYNIDKVPALVFEKDVDMSASCNIRHIQPKNIIFGDASLKGMLSELYRLDRTDELNQLIKRL